jgi:hypothetical protein
VACAASNKAEWISHFLGNTWLSATSETCGTVGLGQQQQGMRKARKVHDSCGLLSDLKFHGFRYNFGFQLVTLIFAIFIGQRKIDLSLLEILCRVFRTDMLPASLVWKYPNFTTIN